MYLFIAVVVFVVVLGAVVDIITRDDSQVRHLPKLVWVMLVVFLPIIGSIAWFLVGRERVARREAVSFGDPRRQEAAVAGPTNMLSTEAELAALEAEIAAAEREERIRRLEAELETKRPGSDSAGNRGPAR